MRPLLLALLFLSAPSAALAQSARYTGPIIDAHLHADRAYEAVGDTAWWPTHLHRPKTDEGVMRESLAQLERHNVVRAVASGTLARVATWRAADPERIIPGVVVGRPRDMRATLARLREVHAAGELAVLGELTWQYQGIAPADSSVAPMLAFADSLDLPVAIHMGLGPPGIALWEGLGYRSRLSSPLELEEVLIRYPRLRVYVMHAGWPMADAMVAMLYAFPNLYVDVGVINWYIPRAEFHSYLRRLIDAGFADRILFGSDQMTWPGAIGEAIEGVDSAPFLSLAQKEAIFCRNAQRFFRLDAALCTATP